MISVIFFRIALSSDKYESPFVDDVLSIDFFLQRQPKSGVKTISCISLEPLKSLDAVVVSFDSLKNNTNLINNYILHQK